MSSSRKSSQRRDKRPQNQSATFSLAGELDLHGQTIESALATVGRLLNRVDLKSGSVWRIIHGHSNTSDDSIRSQLHHFLRTQGPKKLSDFYFEPRNPGATLIVIE